MPFLESDGVVQFNIRNSPIASIGSFAKMFYEGLLGATAESIIVSVSLES